MDQNKFQEPPEDDAVEITDLDLDDAERSMNASGFSLETWVLTPKYRKQRTLVAALSIGLLLFILLLAISPVNRLFLRESGGSSPPIAEPAVYYFGLDANPPWGTLSVDGKRATTFSSGVYQSFSVFGGQHILTWYAAPFAPQQCRLTLPLESGHNRNTCQFVNPAPAPQLGGDISAYIRFPTNLNMLSTAQRASLLQEAQTLLGSQQSNDTLQTGELYAQTPEAARPNARSCTVLPRAAICFAVASQPLRATLRLRLYTGPSLNTSCANSTCDSGSQNCSLFCDIPAYTENVVPRSPAVWQVSIPVQLLWQFSTLDGHIIEDNQADSFILGQQNAFSVFLNITWTGGKWNVTFNSQGRFFGSDNPVCQAAMGDMYTLVFASTPLNYAMQFQPGPTHASGCLLKFSLQSNSIGTPPPSPPPSTTADVMQRFGVLYASNALAHRLWPFLPVAKTSLLDIPH